MSYLVDTNFFVQAHRVAYPLDVVESFWNVVNKLAIDGEIISIDKVKKEMYGNRDDLTIWCKDKLPSDFFKNSTTAIIEYSQLANWANNKSDHYKASAISEFLDADEADAWLIAYAKANDLTLITHEVSSPEGKKKIKIPDVCMPFNVKYTTTIEMFRALGIKF